MSKNTVFTAKSCRLKINRTFKYFFSITPLLPTYQYQIHNYSGCSVKFYFILPLNYSGENFQYSPESFFVLTKRANKNKKTIVSQASKGLDSRVLLDMIVPDLHELLLSVVHVSEIVNHLARLNLQPLGIRPKAWQNKNRSMLRMRSILFMWIFNHSGYPA
jgi:hypothetical protein